MLNNVKFKRISYRNILSVGNMPIEIDLQRSPTTAILGANGQGKSVFLEALAYGLYGKPYRDIVKGKLVNNKNNKGLLIEIDFTSGENDVKIIRSIKPEKFEIHVNGTMIDQESKSRDYQAYLETHLLKMDFETFKQLVLIGKVSYVPFMRLPAAKRRAFIETVLSLNVFATMSALHKANCDEVNDRLNYVTGEIRNVETRINSTKLLIERVTQEYNKRSEYHATEIQARIDSLTAKRKEQQAILDTMFSRLDDLNLESVNADIQVAHKRCSDAKIAKQEAQTEINHNMKQLNFMREHENCPVCLQKIESGFRENKILAFESEIELQQAKVKSADDILIDVGNRVETLENTRQTGIKYLSGISDLKRMNSALDAEIDSLQSELAKPLDKPDISGDEALLAKLIEQLDNFNYEYQELMTEKDYNNMATMLLKDSGIKSVVIDKFLPVINQSINDYLHKLGLFATFALDSQFNEEIKMRGFEPMVYNQLSEGEKLRFDMAVMLAWRDIAKLKSNMSCNLLIMDEVFDSSLDQEGVNAFADLLKILGDLNVFVITHTPEKLAESFRSFVRFEREEGFTVMSTISGM